MGKFPMGIFAAPPISVKPAAFKLFMSSLIFRGNFRVLFSLGAQHPSGSLEADPML